MAQGPIPESEILYPGDLVDVELLVTQTGLLTDMAISDIKRTLWADERFDYQGSRWETRTDKSGLDGSVVERQYLIITVSVRKTPKTQQPQQQLAGLGPVAWAALFALVAAAVVAYSKTMEVVGYNVQRDQTRIVAEQIEAIRNDPAMSAEQKTAALQALGVAEVAPQPSIGGGLAAAGGSIVTAVIIIGVLWALSLSARGRTAME